VGGYVHRGDWTRRESQGLTRKNMKIRQRKLQSHLGWGWLGFGATGVAVCTRAANGQLAATCSCAAKPCKARVSGQVGWGWVVSGGGGSRVPASGTCAQGARITNVQMGCLLEAGCTQRLLQSLKICSVVSRHHRSQHQWRRPLPFRAEHGMAVYCNAGLGQGGWLVLTTACFKS